MAASLKQMRRDSIIKRGEAPYIEYKNIIVKPGFNAEGRTEENDEDDEELFQFIMNGGFSLLPAWEVAVYDETTVSIVDAHRRHKQTGRAIAAGAPLADKDGKIWIPIKVVDGSDIDHLVRIATSNKKKPLKPHQFADICKRLRGFNKTNPEIATLLLCSRGKVDQALLLGDANHDVQALVKEGAITGTEAVKQIRRHGRDAGTVIGKAVEVAKAAGKTHVTAAAFVPSGLNPRTEALRAALNLVHRTLSPYVDSGEPLPSIELGRLQGEVAKGLRAGAHP